MGAQQTHSCSYMAPSLCGARDQQATGSDRATTTDTGHIVQSLCHCMNSGQVGKLWQHPLLTASMAQAGKFLQQSLTAPDTHSVIKQASWRTLCLQHCH